MKKKGESHEDSLELRILCFTWVVETLYYQEGYIGWVGEVQNIKIYPTTKNSYQVRHICPPNRIPETLAGHVRPTGPTYLASLPYPGSRDLTRTCSAPIPDMSGPQPGHVRPSSLSRVNQAYPAPMPGSRGISRTCPAPSLDMWKSLDVV
jgi:hypothetical protein